MNPVRGLNRPLAMPSISNAVYASTVMDGRCPAFFRAAASASPVSNRLISVPPCGVMAMMDLRFVVKGVSLHARVEQNRAARAHAPAWG